MPERNLNKIQETLNAVTPAQWYLNELSYYMKYLASPNHSAGLCTSASSKIRELSSGLAALVKALQTYGYTYYQMDAGLVGANGGDSPKETTCPVFYYREAEEHQKSFAEKTVNQILLGDFTDDVTWAGSVTNLGLSFTGVDAVMDARDLIADVKNGDYGWAIVNAISLLPVIGVVGEVIYQSGKTAKMIDNVSEFADNTHDVLKAGDTAGDVTSSSGIKNWESMYETSSAHKMGGSYKEIHVNGMKGEVDTHHMISYGSSKNYLSFENGVAIQLEHVDHLRTASFDRLKGASEYRDAQRQLIEAGRYMDAFDMDAKDLQKTFGHKYDRGIQEARNYLEELIQKGDLQ